MNTTLEQQWQRVATRHGAHLKPPERIDRGLGSSQDANIAKFCYINKQPIANRTQYADKVPKTTLNELLAANLGRIKDARDLTLPYIAKKCGLSQLTIGYYLDLSATLAICCLHGWQNFATLIPASTFCIGDRGSKVQTTQTERQALNAAIKRATRGKTRKELTALSYPKGPEVGAPRDIYWLGAWMRAQCTAEVLDAFHDKAFMRAGDALQMAMVRSDRLMRDEANRMLANLIDSGGLLFAWHGTTALAGFEVLQ